VKENKYADMNRQCEVQDQFQVNFYVLVLEEEECAALQHPLDIDTPSSVMAIKMYFIVLQ
jgi:hypothetical protein